MAGWWEKRQQGADNPFMILGIPHTGSVSMEWLQGLLQLQQPEGTAIEWNRGAPIDVSRNMIVDSFLKCGAEYLFFLDSDVVCPPNTITQLMSLNVDIASGLYYARDRHGGLEESFPFPCLWVLPANPEERAKARSYNSFRVLPPEYQGKIIEIGAVGMGCCLIRRNVFHKVKPPWFFWTGGRYNNLIDKEDDNGEWAGSEDFYFCRKVKRAGFSIFLDTNIKCRHLGKASFEECSDGQGHIMFSRG